MKKITLLSFLFISITIFQAMEKPILKAGLISYGYYNLLEEKIIYPDTIRDQIFFIYDHEYSKHFHVLYRADFYYSTYNKTTTNLNSLSYFNLNNTLNLYFTFNKPNKVRITAKPMFYYKNGENSFKFYNKFEYSLSVKNFSFKTYYTNNIPLKFEEIFTHSLYLGFYWNFPRYDYLKFKTSISTNLQHTDKKIVSTLDYTRINFEIAFDFNKLNFFDVFDKEEEEE